MKHHPVIQNSDEPCECCGKTWMELREGKITGSSIGPIMAWHDNKKLKFGDPAKRLAVNIAIHELGGEINHNDYTNSHMERGHEQEPLAIQAYEELNFIDVDPGGFIDNGKTGCSPDGIVGEPGLLEVKSVLNHVHYDCIQSGTYDKKYKWQLAHNLKESGRDWIDFISWCPTFCRDKQLYVVRISRDDFKGEFKAIENRLEQFRKLVESVKKQI
jgi:hypothetical protein